MDDRRVGVRTLTGFFTALLLANAVPAVAKTAKTVVVMEGPLPAGRSATRARFDVNAELGRAWVVVDFLEDDGLLGDSSPREIAERVLVPGLSYDRASGEIRYKDDGRD